MVMVPRPRATRPSFSKYLSMRDTTSLAVPRFLAICSWEPLYFCSVSFCAIVNLEHAADFQAAAFCMTDGSRVYVNQELLKPARQAFMEFLLQGGV